jgi:DNA repair protein RecN (Recombination protein N)
MLKRLVIKNYAIIDELEINFSPGMNAITGETGAGKSIIMGALGLILGNRSDSTALLNKEIKCVIEGIFHCEHNGSIHDFLVSNELDLGNELFIRREITIQGKSRAFINDTPVNLSQ